MDTLATIIAHKLTEVAQSKQQVTARQLEQQPLWAAERRSLRASLAARAPGLIAEFKRRSPSKGVINDEAQPPQVTEAYARAGAAGVSILTDEVFFGGSPAHLQTARPHLPVPILRKDFMVDEYQLLQARAWGADAILLIAACLAPRQISELSRQARALGLEVLLEVHNLPELQTSPLDHVDVVGVNNRNLKNFEVSLDVSLQLAEHIPANLVKISESGINQPAHLLPLWQAGYRGFLVGENFMKTSDPGQACAAFVVAARQQLGLAVPV
jgi:indole-3-glycerol phosphate synthase